ncbi:MAG: hypothetical protein KAS32_24700 [Candidatus Peribacteraceae bacterium]|nr:hypothetical protein [Candidatus Peribacteraceae bacterium]
MEKDEKIKEKKLLYQDKTKPLKERRDHYNSSMEKMMNPFPANVFNPDDFEPMGEDMKEVANRERITPPKKLPTFGIKPKKIREGQMIGMYESKQDLYLMFAHRCNELQAEIDLLKSALM